LENEELISTILPDYILHLAGVVSLDSVPRDFDYTLVTAYLPKGIRVVRMQQDKIAKLKFNDFNLGDRKNYNMLSPYKYSTRTKGEELENHPPAMDYEPRAVRPLECDEYSTFRKAPRG
jgi:hypothetical protein